MTATVHPLTISPIMSLLILYCDSQLSTGNIPNRHFRGLINFGRLNSSETEMKYQQLRLLAFRVKITLHGFRVFQFVVQLFLFIIWSFHLKNTSLIVSIVISGQRHNMIILLKKKKRNNFKNLILIFVSLMISDDCLATTIGARYFTAVKTSQFWWLLKAT